MNEYLAWNARGARVREVLESNGVDPCICQKCGASRFDSDPQQTGPRVMRFYHLVNRKAGLALHHYSQIAVLCPNCYQRVLKAGERISGKWYDDSEARGVGMIIYEKRLDATDENALLIIKEQSSLLKKVSVEGPLMIRENCIVKTEYVYISDVPYENPSEDDAFRCIAVCPDDKEIKEIEWDYKNAELYARDDEGCCLYNVDFE